MKKIWMPIVAMGLMIFTISFSGLDAQAAKEEEEIHTGVYIGDMDVSGMTASEAATEVENYMEGLKTKKFTLKIGTDKVEASAADFGLKWTNPEVVEDAVKVGKAGNIVQRYKITKDLEQSPIIYDLEYEFDRKAVETFVNDKCLEFNTEPENATLTRSNGEFQISEGASGNILDVEASVEAIYSYINGEWNESDGSVELVMKEQQPEVTYDELAMVTDLLGEFSTNFSSSSSSRAMNLDRGAEKVNGTILFPGEVFSMYEVCAPFTIENGYGEGSAFENGKVVPSIGGGICQVSTTLYNAVIRSELEIVERFNHTMRVGYVEASMDAAIAGTYMDLKFKNNTEYPIYIEGYTYNRDITFRIYGHETRPAGRSVRFESEVTGTTPAGVEIKASNAAIGSIEKTQDPHEGSTAKLWKIVTENGQETRTLFNSSTYYASPTIYSVGISSSNPEHTAAVRAAIATGNIDHVRAVVNSILTTPAKSDNVTNEPEETEPPQQTEPPQEEQQAEDPEVIDPPEDGEVPEV